MKKKLLLSAMLLAGWGLSAMAQEAKVFPCVADTWIREQNPGDKNGTKDAIELGMDGTNRRAGLLGFDFSIPQGMKVQSATLKIVSKVARTSQDISVYGYSHDFTEGDANWNVEVSYYDEARASGEITTFRMVGQNGKAPYDSGINTDNQDIEKWINYVDVTSYVKTLSPNTQRVNLMLTADYSDQAKFYPQGLTGTENLFKNSDGTFVSSIEKALLAPELTVTFVEDAAQNTDVILPTADTQIRLGNKDDKSKADALEIKKTSDNQRFYGLMRFDLPVEILNTEKYEVQSVTLRLVTTQNKGDRNMQIFDYDNNFAENTIYENESDFVGAALAKEPIAEYSANGYGSFSMGDNKSGWTNSDYTDVEKWTNYIDLTNYVAEKANSQESSINILITKKNEHNDAMKIATKEATDITNAATEIANQDAFTFKAEDLWPQLVVIYTNKEAVVPEKPDLFCGTDETTQSGREHPDYDICIDSKKPFVSVFFPSPEEGDVYYRYELKSENQAPLMGVKGRRADTDVEWTQAFPNENYESNYHEIILPSPATGTLFVKVVSDNSADQTHEYSFVTNLSTPTSVEELEAAEAVAEYFTLQGVKVANPERGQIYIKVAAGKASKIVF